MPAMLPPTLRGPTLKPERVHQATALRYHHERRAFMQIDARHDCSMTPKAQDERVQNAYVARQGKRATDDDNLSRL